MHPREDLKGMIDKSEYVTVKEASKIVRVSTRTIETWIAKGALSVKRSIGRKILLLRSEVEPK